MSEVEPKGIDESLALPEPQPASRDLTTGEIIFGMGLAAMQRDWDSLSIIGLHAGIRILEAKFQQTASLPLNQTVFDASFSIAPSAINEELDEITSRLSPAQQNRINRYEHLLRSVEESQIKLFKGEECFMLLYDENWEYQRNEEGYKLGIVVTQETVDGLSDLADRMAERFADNPATAAAMNQVQEKLRAERQAKIAERKKKDAAGNAAIAALRERSTEVL